MDREAWHAVVLGVSKIWKWLSNWTEQWTESLRILDKTILGSGAKTFASTRGWWEAAIHSLTHTHTLSSFPAVPLSTSLSFSPHLCVIPQHTSSTSICFQNFKNNLWFVSGKSLEENLSSSHKATKCRHRISVCAFLQISTWKPGWDRASHHLPNLVISSLVP